jgi:hypothetical protein
VLFGAVLLVTQSASAEPHLYRWVDQDGQVHYSDQPVRGAKQVEPKVVAIPEPAPSSDAGNARGADCQRRKDQLATYRNAGKISETDGLGQTREYSEAERQQLIQRTERAVREACGLAAGQ